MKYQTSFLVFMAILIFSYASNCRSDCKACEDEYRSAIEECQLLYDSPDDADQLKICIDEAQSDYESCIDDCED